MRLVHFVSAGVQGVVLLLGMSLRFVTPPLLGATVSFCGTASLAAAEPAAPKRSYHLPRGDAATTLRQFATISGSPVLFMMDKVQGEQTNAVHGDYTPGEALKLMLAGTSLEIVQAADVEGLVVGRRAQPAPREVAVRDPNPKPPTKNMSSPSVTSKLRAWFAHAALAVTTAAAAQETPAGSSAKPEVVQLPTFTVSTETADRYRADDSVSAVRIRTSLLETPSSISVLTRDFIDDVAPIRIYDATRYIAGVQESRGITFGDRQIIRGFESEGRTVDNFFDNFATNSEEALIERIEVSKGPNAILAPGGVPGGAINIVSKSPQFTQKRTLTVLAGTFDAQKVTLDMTDKVAGHDNMAYRFIGAYQDTERYWSSDARFKRKLIAPQFTWRPSATSELTVKYSYLDAFIFREPALILDASVVPGREPILAPGFKAKSLNGIQPWSGISTQTHNAQFQYSNNFNAHLTTRLAGRWLRYTEDSEQEFFTTPGFTNRYNPNTGDLTQDYTWALQNTALPYDATANPYVATLAPYYNPASIPVRGEKADVHIDNYALQNDWVLTFNQSIANFQTVAGWAYTHQKSTDQRVNGTLPAINLTAPAVAAYPVWVPTLIRNSEGEFTNVQAYVNQRVAFLKDRVALNGGYLYYRTGTKSIDRATTAPLSRLDDSRGMYLGSVMVKVLPQLSAYYSYSTNAAPVIVNNAPLWREGKQHEFGAKWEVFKDRLSVNAAYFEISQTNVSVPNPEFAVNPSAPNSLLADYKNHGEELEITGALTRNLSIVGSVSKLKLRDALGRRVRSVADDLASVLLNYRFTDGTLKGLSLNFGASYTGERAGDATATNFTPLKVPTKISFFIPGYTVYTAGASYSWDRYQVRLFIDNLADDKDYVQQAGARISGPGLSIATGRNIRGSFTLRF